MSAVFNFTFVPWFRSVAPYIHTHRDKTFVVGVAGEAIAAGKLQHIAQDLALIQSMGVKIVLVHGFRPQVNEQLAAKGHEAKYSHGMRITDEVALDCAQEAAGQLRFEIEAAFSQGLPNTPMAGATVRVISGNFIGDAHAVRVLRFVALGCELLVDLWPEAVHQHDLHAHALNQRQVLRNVLQLAGCNRLTGNADDEGFVTVCVDVRRNRPEPGNKREVEDG